MNKMLGSGKKTTNIGHQLLQRETNVSRNSKEFASNLFRERLRVAKNLYKTDLRGHFGCVNAIEFSHGGTFLASGGDDKRVLVWNVEKSLTGRPIPRGLTTEQASNIFCLGFDSKNRKIISGGNDTLAILHDFETGKLDNIYKHDGPVYGLSIDPQNDDVFSTASENGEVLLIDQRSTVRTVVASVPSAFHSVEFHPTMSNLLVTANSKRGATLYDLRYPKQPVILYGNLKNTRSCMSVRFNRTGKLILGLRRRLPPILYNVNSPDPICTFYHSNYYNSCTMKSCTFAGEDDEMVISGSDDFNLYVWRLSDIDLNGTAQWVESTKMVLYGHRSIVNQVRYNREKCLLASSGVEKIIKIWSPFSQRYFTGSLTKEVSCSDNPRELYSPYNLFTMELPENWHHPSHDFSSANTNEDPHMMAFFDSLIQQEIEEWATSTSSEQGDRSISSFFSCGSTSSSNSSSRDSSTSSSSSSCSSDSDSSIENNVTPGRRRRRSKRQAMMRKNAQSKQRNKKTKIAKIKVNQLQKPINRIAYLIAKKRNTLRRLAIKGSSANNRRSSKLAVVANGHKQRNNIKNSHRQRSAGRQKDGQNHAPSDMNNEKPSTSTAAAKNQRIELECEIQKKAPKTKSDPKVSSEEESGSVTISSASRSNVMNTSSSSNINVASTSTGITSNFRDAFLRLSRQIFMSDSDDDDDDDDELEDHTSKLHINLNSRNEEIEMIKTNGVNKLPSSKNKSIPARESRTPLSHQRSLGSNQRPRNSAALNVINNEMILPQRRHPTKHDTFLNTIKNKGQSGCSRMNGCKRMSPLLGTDAAGVENSSPNKAHKKRRFTEVDRLEEDLPTSSKNSNNDRNDLLDENTTSTSSSTTSSSPGCISTKTPKCQQQLHSSLERQKWSGINEYIKMRAGFASADFGEHEQEGFEYNNTDTINNDIIIFEEEDMSNPIHIQLTPQRPNVINSESNNMEYALSSSQYNNNNSHLFTPDSGVSLNNSTTPSTVDQNDIKASTSATTTRTATYLSSPCYEHDNCDLRNIDEHKSDDDEGVVVINNRKTNLNQFQQKVARVRRNYRKQFFDDTESD